ncbi:SulP family inorganic anion transporter [Candidatus Micrarchaeota archaeon]|nr:SulP family inorganic anion transporter [Candidatus Micrarchaeota archaeon]
MKAKAQRFKSRAKEISHSFLELLKPNSVSFKYAKEDFIAGTIVMVVAIPLCLAIAIASGVPPVYGIYTAIIAGFLVALFGGTELGVAGPAAAMTVLLYSIVAKFGLDGLMVAAILAGLIQIAMGLSGIGRVVKFIPYTVVVGFTTGIGLLIFIQQLGNLTGIDTKAENAFGQLSAFVLHFGQFNVAAFGLGMLTLVLLFAIPRFSKKIPASFAALVAVTAVALALGLTVKTIGIVPSGLPTFSIPAVDIGKLNDLFPSALAIALLASIESLLSAVSLDGMTGTKHSSSKELVGQGIANTVLPFFHGIPATSVIVRSATNVKNGAKTRLSAIVHSVMLLGVLLVLAPLAQYIPMPVLAGILMFTAFHLVGIAEIKHFLADSKSDVVVLAVTVGSTVFLELTTAILVGFTLAGLLFIKKMSDNVEVSQVASQSPASSETTLAPDIAGVARTYRISGPLFFGSAHMLEKIADETPREACPALVLDLTHVDYLDSSGIAVLASIAERRSKTGEVYLAVTEGSQVKTKIIHSDVVRYIKVDNLVGSVKEGLQKAELKYGKSKQMHL